MDWIERLLHISPDGGSGYFEWLILAFVAFLLVARPLWRRVRMRRPQRHPGPTRLPPNVET